MTREERKEQLSRRFSIGASIGIVSLTTLCYWGILHKDVINNVVNAKATEEVETVEQVDGYGIYDVIDSRFNEETGMTELKIVIGNDVHIYSIQDAPEDEITEVCMLIRTNDVTKWKVVALR